MALAAVFCAALLVRIGAMWAQYPSLQEDPDAYRRLAVTWRTTGVFGLAEGTSQPTEPRPTAYRPPLYPLLLSVLLHGDALSPMAVAVAHVVLGAATAAITYLLAWRAGLGRGAWLAVGLTACDPILMRQASLVMTETLAALLAVVGLVAVARFHRKPTLAAAGVVGSLVGLATLCRPTFLPWLLLLVGWVLLGPKPSRRIAHAAALLGAAAAVLAPWTIRNLVQLDRPIFTTTHGGYTLWLGNNDHYYDHLFQGRSRPFDAAWLLPRLEQLRAAHLNDEVGLDRALYQEAGDSIRRRPGAFAYACLLRIRDLWRLTPRKVQDSESTQQTLMRIAVGGWYAAVFLLTLRGLIAVGRHLVAPPWIGLVLLCVAFTAVHTFYWTDMRMRGPLMPGVSLLAAAGAARLTQRRSDLQSVS